MTRTSIAAYLSEISFVGRLDRALPTQTRYSHGALCDGIRGEFLGGYRIQGQLTRLPSVLDAGLLTKIPLFLFTIYPMRVAKFALLLIVPGGPAVR